MSKKKTATASKILVSACLLGEKTRYDGGHSQFDNPILERWKAERRVISFCPEVEGGLPLPRVPAEVINADGDLVILGEGKVINLDGLDVTMEFVVGAQKALQIAQDNDITVALLKAKSPSCGSKITYDGTFSNTLKPGKGITAALLERNGIQVFNEDGIGAVDEHLRESDISKP